MGLTQCGFGRGSTLTPARYAQPGAGFGNVTTTESWAASRAPIAFNIQRLGVSADANSTGRSIQVRKNSANGTVVASPANTTAGTTYDTTHVDSFAIGDRLDLQANGAGAWQPICGVFQVDGGSNNFSWMANGVVNVLTAATAVFFPFGGTGMSATNTNASLMRSSGTVNYLGVAVPVAGNGTGTVTLLKNTVAQTITVSLPASTTGLFEDTTHTVSFASGDLLTYSVTPNGTTFPDVGLTSGVLWGGAQWDMGCADNAGYTPSASNQFYSLFGQQGATGAQALAETTLQLRFFQSVLTSNFRAVVSINGITTSQTFRVRKNTANGNQNFVVPASTTGTFEDTTNTDAFLSSDLASILATGGTGGTTMTPQTMITVNPNPTLQTVNVTCTSSMTMIRQTGQVIAIGCASAVTVARQAGQVIAIGCASTVSTLRQTGKNIAIGCASSVSLITHKTTSQIISITCTSAVSMLRAIGKNIAIGCVSSVSMTKAIAKTIAIACTSSTTVKASKITAQAIAITCASAVTMTRQVGKLVAIGCSSSVSMLRSMGKSVAIGCASLVSVTKSISKTVAIGCASTVTIVRGQGKLIAINCVSTVSVIKAVAHMIAITCASTVTLVAQKVFLWTVNVICTSAVTLTIHKVTSQIISVTCTSAVTLKRSVGKFIAITATTAVTVSRRVAQIISIACASSVSLAKAIGHHIAIACTSLVTISTGGGSKIQVILITCASAVSMPGRVIGKVVRITATGSIRITKSTVHHVSIVCSSIVSIITKFLLPLIRTKIFGRASKPIVFAEGNEPLIVSGRGSGVRIDGYPEPIDPEEF